ncbi:hypothetical protein A3A84_00050 [Candidatus Collierbacteria bacterium RIFCSPLOWO2_01_FULL_50_23]|uniref:Uncharacterized protein n=2 Tax=Candidatus Collieribacteriota TaxID=1752725 RepID=A0A1F5EU72_9BACT|nr:MAG: hypothetical protein A3D09_04095 [Candidatus Collierbacteria bacterium RIFCSPHIGHO2_02_FULL_49_10]OGD71258.1 MAG: hypothetical protein A2703_00835 [Candidatus Collierbacteria bacterium RIFCSPHIGHO2_01_FULL_50_25]OGD74197.1 MAG: hypothetical protein A3A84_00050 [Candidatus Collierbacteria bacterium RIFCSPLOWO2_01_FULL_50_23]
MADFGGGIPGQFVSELSSIPKAVVETITSATPTPTPVGSEQAAAEKGQSQADPLADLKQQKAAAAARRLSEVRQELQDFFESSKRQKEQMETAMEEQKKEEEAQIKKSKKKQEEQEVLQRLSSQYGGTGEVVKSGN